MPKYIPCSVCQEMTSTPATVSAPSPETGRPVEAALCEAEGSCERVWRAAVEELVPIVSRSGPSSRSQADAWPDGAETIDAPRVEIEVEFSED